MNDVVERLKRYIKEGDIAGENEKTLSALLRDAANEIERLRAKTALSYGPVDSPFNYGNNSMFSKGRS